MTKNDILRLLEAYKDGGITKEDAAESLSKAAFEDMGFANVDHSREARQGFPEVVYAAGKTKEQVLAILQSLAAASDGSLLATRASREQYDFVKAEMPEAEYDEEARAIYVRRAKPVGAPPEDEAHEILIITAGTSDIPVAAEARLTAELYGNRVKTLYDCGVAGIHRLAAHEDEIRCARVIICIAGMEGALASVIGGLASGPVIAVPTSVGYGAALHGVTALLSMLSSCAAGVSVVNIDNGFGAGVLASKINRLN
ncbi:MAG: nickel pincer cofactor biosynthesis protein LarB [Veillonellaceae bacterium]|uniref:nickel pincer cofactor biosynthesis protein LarB n=1 Tax=uncultured Selenomonas sp. TaxID=159275 RepID=UPI0025DDE7B0|nr:nickel pincer cofactor biosynthesis protein LarB [uncultured Selenomonas sp.]MCI7539581.1 nickel pincer cofactor biosynthesis protein LarB [Veillonellaceae bacterium]MDD6128109.1 nickel pincer cofactor biosynthesis protein LarB [Veillonellaceae bacterium]MDD6697471.1 nickel pincer cofactor biosynthesis protein LarB [Veillonellaceae bacterium]MDY6349108.1 nickel pincer cofactor biosynthesis protein LarB [Selenomonas sp.]